MLRSEHVALVVLIKALKPGTTTQFTRGYIDYDNTSLSGVTTTLRVGSCLGIPVFRKAALADGKYEYDDWAGNNIAAN